MNAFMDFMNNMNAAIRYAQSLEAEDKKNTASATDTDQEENVKASLAENNNQNESA